MELHSLMQLCHLFFVVLFVSIANAHAAPGKDRSRPSMDELMGRVTVAVRNMKSGTMAGMSHVSDALSAHSKSAFGTKNEQALKNLPNSAGKHANTLNDNLKKALGTNQDIGGKTNRDNDRKVNSLKIDAPTTMNSVYTN